MRAFIRPLLTALRIACLSALLAPLAGHSALAQSKELAPGESVQQPQLQQIPLTEKHLQGVLSAQKDMDAITSQLQDNATPDPKTLTQLDMVAKKHGFASYDEYTLVIDNIGLVLSGFDPVTRKYVGTQAAIKAQIAQVEADKKMSPADKKQALADLSAALKSPEPSIENKGNIDLVAKYYDRLAELIGDEQN
ncbi:MAG: hypothetical protein JO283_10160 [Bradyrhizobium sp.]|nr:hypothetical protein [Bradyrhizobium sp.]